MSSGVTVDDVRRELKDRPLLASNRGLPWMGVAVDEFDGYFANDVLAPPRDHNAITINLGVSPLIIQHRCGRSFRSPSQIGEASIIPAGHESRWQGRVPANICLRFAPEILRQAGYDARATGEPRVRMANGFRLRDPMLAHYGTLFRHELTRPAHPTQILLIESLTTTLLMHLLRGYTDAVGVDDRWTTSSHSAAIRRVLRYIDDQPNSRIALEELADVAGVSRFHFCRVFKRELGTTPASYVERARIERAKTLIRSGQWSLAEVAHEIGFSDQSHFTRRFQSHERCTPAAYAREYGRRSPSRRN